MYLKRSRAVTMEKFQQQQWPRSLKSMLTYKNATIVVCFFNVIAALLLLHGSIFSSSSSHKVLNNMKASEEIRRSMVPVDLIKRVREIGKEVNHETEVVQQKDVRQTAAVDLISRLSNYRSYSESGNLKALEEWRKRKVERARQRSLVKNGTSIS